MSHAKAARTIRVAPVRKSVRVNADAARAFDAFTRSIDRWWPRTWGAIVQSYANQVNKETDHAA